VYITITTTIGFNTQSSSPISTYFQYVINYDLDLVDIMASGIGFFILLGGKLYYVRNNVSHL